MEYQTSTNYLTPESENNMGLAQINTRNTHLSQEDEDIFNQLISTPSAFELQLSGQNTNMSLDEVLPILEDQTLPNPFEYYESNPINDALLYTNTNSSIGDSELSTPDPTITTPSSQPSTFSSPHEMSELFSPEAGTLLTPEDGFLADLFPELGLFQSSDTSSESYQSPSAPNHTSPDQQSQYHWTPLEDLPATIAPSATLLSANRQAQSTTDLTLPQDGEYQPTSLGSSPTTSPPTALPPQASYPCPQLQFPPPAPQPPYLSSGPSPTAPDLHDYGTPSGSGWLCTYPGCKNRKTFTRPCDLRKHHKRHTHVLHCRHPGCPQAAEASFSSEKDRSRHEAKHDPKTPCEWPGCRKLFSRADNMRDHVKRIHRR